MANPEHVRIVAAGKEAVERWIRQQPCIDADHCLDLRGAALTKIQLSGADLRYVRLEDANLELARLNGADLRFASLDGTVLEKAKLVSVNFRGAHLRRVEVRKIHLRGADFRYAVLEDVKLNEARLRDANFGRASLRNVELNGADLRYACFQAAYLEECKLNHANLNSTKFQNARLIRTEFRNSRLRRANLKRSDNYRTDFSDADCTAIKFKHAILNTAQLLRTELSKANLSGVTMYAVLTDDWHIDRAMCTYFFVGYFDGLKFKKKRIPKQGFLSHKEFEDRFKSRPTIEFMFEHGMPALGPAILATAIDSATLERPETGLRLLDITARGGMPRAIIEVAEKVSRKDVLALVQAYYDQTIRQMRHEIDALRGDKESLLQIVSKKMLLPALQAGPKRTSRPDQKSKYTPEKIDNMLASFDKHLEEEKGVKYAWECVAEEHGLSSGKAAEMAVRRHPKKNK